ncbi:hypothetical protein JCM8547_002067 [Rhodosporidiobolus lusitaniae]
MGDPRGHAAVPSAPHVRRPVWRGPPELPKDSLEHLRLRSLSLKARNSSSTFSTFRKAFDGLVKRSYLTLESLTTSIISVEDFSPFRNLRHLLLTYDGSAEGKQTCLSRIRSCASLDALRSLGLKPSSWGNFMPLENFATALPPQVRALQLGHGQLEPVEVLLFLQHLPPSSFLSFLRFQHSMGT